MRSAAGVVTLLCGIWIVIFTFAFILFARTSDAHPITDAFRTTLFHRGVLALVPALLVAVRCGVALIRRQPAPRAEPVGGTTS